MAFTSFFNSRAHRCPPDPERTEQLREEVAAVLAEAQQARRHAQRLQVQAWAALARAQITVSGAVNREILDRLEQEIDAAQAAGFEVSVELPAEIYALAPDASRTPSPAGGSSVHR